MRVRFAAADRGSVLIHVMVTGALVALIAALLMRMAMFRATIAHRGGAALVEKRLDQAGFNSIMTNWNAANAVCSNTVPNYNCTGVAGACGCTCTPTLPDFPTVTAALVAGNCQITVVSTDMP